MTLFYFKVVRSDHLHRHMKNKHPEVNHPGPQSNRRKPKSLEDGNLMDFSLGMSSEFADSPTIGLPNMGSTNGLSALLWFKNDLDCILFCCVNFGDFFL